MSISYVEPATACFRKEMRHGVEQIRIPVRRNWFALLFIPLWLAGWTAGGIFAIAEFVRGGEPFLALWLCGWLVGWLFAAVVLGEQVAGSEVIRTIGHDLEVSGGIGRLRRTRRYRGDKIANLSSNASNWFAMFQLPWPTFMTPRWGAVKFDYGAATVYLAPSASEAEGRMIVEWLKPRLPSSASSQ